MKRTVIIACALITIILLAWNLPGLAAPLGADPTPGANGPAQAVEQAITEAIRSQRDDVPALALFETHITNIRLSGDQQWGTALLVPLDPTTGETIPSEPGLALTRWDGAAWQVILPSNAAWLATLQGLPNDLLSPEHKAVYTEQFEAFQAQLPTAPLTGFYLPWPKGQTHSVSQTVKHDAYTASGSAHYSFDFYVSGQLWNIHASKAGYVRFVKQDIETCMQYTCSDTQPLGNYIVLEDQSTTPYSYVLYLHLAKDSVPPELTPGTYVQRGQIIGVADNTGQSWGHHLHFMVHLNPKSYYSQSVDITFADVDINGGRPRTPAEINEHTDGDSVDWCNNPKFPPDVCDAGQTNYVSGNGVISDTQAPVGALTDVYNGQMVFTGTLALTGLASDVGSGLATAQFIANYVANGASAWHDLGPVITADPSAPAYNWDWCADIVPDGMVSVALRLTDKAGNTTPAAGLTHVVKRYACPAACQPSADQVALFASTDYNGACDLFDIGNHATLGLVGDNKAASILVGANVQATLYLNNDFTGRGETFLGEDNNLADNRISSGAASALKVAERSEVPAAPRPQNPAPGGSLTLGDVVPFTWENAAGAAQFQVVIAGAAAITSEWQSNTFWNLNSLVEGSYTWQVRGRNPAGDGPWSAAQTFSVIADPNPLPATLSLPFSDGMETDPGNWSGSGLWRWVNNSNHTTGGSHSWWYQQSSGNYSTGAPTAGELTSAPISISAAGYYLRFYFLYQSETHGPLWDQRWLQIAVDNGPFQNVDQLADDPFSNEITSGNWLKSKPYDLSAYAGHTIRLRFAFNSLDANFNAFKGWGIDDVSINTTAPPACADADNSPATATSIGYAQTASGAICPNGDQDFYKFTGQAGDTVGADVEAKPLGSLLDSYLILLGPDGQTVLAENDDKILEKLTDSRLTFTLPADGTYYLKVRAWNHPTAGSEQYIYTLRLFNENTPPAVALTNPAEDSYLPGGTISVTATASDASGMSHVEFYWHNGNWTGPEQWQRIGIDTNSADGWGMNFNTSLADQSGLAIYAKAYDRAGNWAISGAWNLAVDRTPPISLLSTLPVTQSSTAIQLLWLGVDDISGITEYDLQWSINNAAWQNYPVTFTGVMLSTWVVGDPGKRYDFRLRAIDSAGNTEDYPAAAEAYTTIIPADELCPTGDAFENDNTYQTAQPITDTAQTHTFCNLLAADGLNDEDWLRMEVTAGQGYILQTQPLDPSAAVVIELYDSDGTTKLGETSPVAFGDFSKLVWNSTQSGTVYARLRHLDGRVAGGSVAYTIALLPGYRIFLPTIYR